MPEINGLTLMMAIQAVDSKITEIVKRLENDNSPEAGELELLLLSYEKTLTALKMGYEQALQTPGNLPPYDQLVRE